MDNGNAGGKGGGLDAVRQTVGVGAEQRVWGGEQATGVANEMTGQNGVDSGVASGVTGVGQGGAEGVWGAGLMQNRGQGGVEYGVVTKHEAGVRVNGVGMQMAGALRGDTGVQAAMGGAALGGGLNMGADEVATGANMGLSGAVDMSAVRVGNVVKVGGVEQGVTGVSAEGNAVLGDGTEVIEDNFAGTDKRSAKRGKKVEATWEERTAKVFEGEDAHEMQQRFYELSRQYMQERFSETIGNGNA